MASNRLARICRWLLGYSKTSRTMCLSSSQERQALISPVRHLLVSVLSVLPKHNTCFTKWLPIRKWRLSFYPKLLFRSQAILLKHMRQVRPILPLRNTKTESGLTSFVITQSISKHLLGKYLEYTGSNKLRIKEKIWV
jgi:hypothetical protein